MDAAGGGYIQDMDVLVLALAIVGALLAAIEIINRRGRALLPWAVEAVALALLVPALAGL